MKKIYLIAILSLFVLASCHGCFPHKHKQDKYKDKYQHQDDSLVGNNSKEGASSEQPGPTALVAVIFDFRTNQLVSGATITATPVQPIQAGAQTRTTTSTSGTVSAGGYIYNYYFGGANALVPGQSYSFVGSKSGYANSLPVISQYNGTLSLPPLSIEPLAP